MNYEKLLKLATAVCAEQSQEQLLVAVDRLRTYINPPTVCECVDPYYCGFHDKCYKTVNHGALNDTTDQKMA